jgi:DNA replication and repair protein RecF
MHLDLLALHQFRNLDETLLRLGPGAMRVLGANGQGKTNLLEAVHLLTQGWSFRTRKNPELVRWERGEATLRAEGVAGGAPHKIALGFELATKTRRLRLDGRELGQASELLGLFGVVHFGPGDIATVQGGPDERRLFLDALLSQENAEGRDRLGRCKQVLRQRNALLKMGPGGGGGSDAGSNEAMLDAFDEQLSLEGSAVLRLRRDLVARLDERVRVLHTSLSGGAEEAALGYHSSWGEAVTPEECLAQIRRRRPRERELRTTLAGPQRDDLTLQLSGQGAREYGSQGQQRSLALALKLAAAQLLEERFGEPPILLLDDIFSELDPRRRQALGDLVARSGQVFLAAPSESDIPFSADRTLRVERGVVTEERT